MRFSTLSTKLHSFKRSNLEVISLAQERLGHKDITTTMNFYSHVLPSSAKEAAEMIGQLVYAS